MLRLLVSAFKVNVQLDYTFIATKVDACPGRLNQFMLS